MDYHSPYQPQPNKAEFKRIGMQAGQNILEKTIIYGAQFMKFVVQFVIDAIKQVLGR